MSILDEARTYRAIIEKAVVGLPDADALQAVSLFPKWEVGVFLEAGKRVSHRDKLYRVKNGMGHTTQVDWTPDVAVSLFEEVCESATGTIDSPIPYSGNMVLEAGKYYEQDGIVYLCARDSGVAVYHNLSELVGIYVEKG